MHSNWFKLFFHKRPWPTIHNIWSGWDFLGGQVRDPFIKSIAEISHSEKHTHQQHNELVSHTVAKLHCLDRQHQLTEIANGTSFTDDSNTKEIWSNIQLTVTPAHITT
jgi:hypothetical protein